MSEGETRRVAEGRRFRRFIGLSVGCHVLAAAMLGFAPSPRAPLVVPIISVDLLAALPQDTPQEAPAASKPAPAPEPVAKPAPPPPPKPKKVVLPKKAQSVAKKPRKADRPPKREKPEERDLDDFLKELRAEAGEITPPTKVAKAQPAPVPSQITGQRVDPEMAKWLLAVDRRVRALWVTPPEFLDRELETRLTVELSADGRVLGEPRVLKRSGDPFWDDSAIRAVMRASPLPPPPGPGEWTFAFPSRTYP